MAVQARYKWGLIAEIALRIKHGSDIANVYDGLQMVFSSLPGSRVVTITRIGDASAAVIMPASHSTQTLVQIEFRRGPSLALIQVFSDKPNVPLAVRNVPLAVRIAQAAAKGLCAK
jgi:hypothetical protein